MKFTFSYLPDRINPRTIRTPNCSIAKSDFEVIPYCAQPRRSLNFTPTIETAENRSDLDSSVHEYLHRYGYNSFSSCMLYDGIRYYFPPEGNGFIGYFDYSPLLVVLGEPVCPSQDYGYFTEKFLSYCHAHNKICIFAIVGEEFVASTSHLSWTKIAIGDDMVFNIQEYTPSGDKAKKVRSAKNQILKRGARVKEYQRSLYPDPELEHEFESMTQRWLHSHSRFQMYLLDLELFALSELKRYLYVEYEGRVVAILTCLPIYARTGYLLEDLIRDPNGPNGATELLVLEALRLFKEEGIEMATMGLSPRIEIRRDWGFSWWGASLTRLGVMTARKLSGLDALYHYRKKFNTRHLERNYLLKHPAGIGIHDLVCILKSFNMF
jgi:phosphatidylglycerol lysyltransferase